VPSSTTRAEAGADTGTDTGGDTGAGDTGAILLYRIPRVVIGESRTLRSPGEAYLRSRGVEVLDLDSAECRALMNAIIAARPDVWHEDIGEP
jgi:cytosine/creatinine deaminase